MSTFLLTASPVLGQRFGHGKEQERPNMAQIMIAKLGRRETGCDLVV
ncbi:hypothetical protein [Ruegeria conchae]|nr:hypothetical protein [Ruegeria conchae]